MSVAGDRISQGVTCHVANHMTLLPPPPTEWLTDRHRLWKNYQNGNNLVIFTAHKRSLGQGNMFRSCVCQEFCPRGVWYHRRGAWSRGVPGTGGCLLPGGCAWWRPPHSYCCGQYASYWNAFLWLLFLKDKWNYYENCISHKHLLIAVLTQNQEQFRWWHCWRPLSSTGETESKQRLFLMLPLTFLSQKFHRLL